MAMIFQEPMTALNPVMRCGDQIDEVLATHTQLDARATRRATVLEIVRAVQPARARAHDRRRIRTSSPAASASAS